MGEGSATTSVGGFTIKASTGTASNGITTTIFVVSRNGVQGFANDASGIYSAAVSVQERSLGGVVEDVNEWVAAGGAAALQAESEANARGTTAEPVAQPIVAPPPPPPPPTPTPQPQVSNTETNDDAIPVTQPQVEVSSLNSIQSRDRPFSRTYNPLSQFSSYNYAISLYMLTPEAVNYLNIVGDSGLSDIVNGSGNLPPSAKAYLISQSGGISANQPRAITNNEIPGNTPGVDYYIDDLSFVVQTAGTENNGTSTYNTDFKFNIVDPYGYGFISKLTDASKKILATSEIARNAREKLTPYDHPFVMVIRFYGYDASGNLVTSDFSSSADQITSDSNAAYERYFQIKITQVQFKIDGRSVTYQFQAAGYQLQIAYGKSRSLTQKQMTISGATVNEMLESLMQQLTEYESGLATGQGSTNTNTYRINILDDKIKNGRLISDFQYDPTTTASAVSTSTRSTIKSADAAKVINQPIKKMSVKAGQPIVKIIDSIIAGSTFVSDSLSLIATGDANAEYKSKTPTKDLEWYCVVPTINFLGIDTKRNDWCYEIVYNIRLYQVPYVRTSLARKSKYYGPHKRYEYYFTGQNSEVIDYQQTFNNLYFVTTLQTQNSPSSQDVANNVGIGTTTKTSPAPAPADKTGSVGTGRTSEVTNQLRAALYSVGDLAQASITILGDPDFLMQSVTSSTKSLQDAVQKNIETFTIDPNGGQVFIEINFQETTDYDSNMGIMPIKETIAFYEDPRVRLSGIKGLVYKILSVACSFKGGKFTQKLDGSIVTSKDLLDVDEQVSNSNPSTFPGAGSSGNGRGRELVASEYNNVDPGEIPGITVSDRNQTDTGAFVSRDRGQTDTGAAVYSGDRGQTDTGAVDFQRLIGGTVDDDAGSNRKNQIINGFNLINNARE